MSSALKSPAPIVAQLKNSLKELQDALNPVTAQSIESLTSKMKESSQNSKLQSAQMYVSLAYVILDLVWILLKVSGVDPKTHPVTNDLVRVQEYLKKVHTASKQIEQKQSGGIEIEEDKPAPVDKAKVGRFLKHALGTPAGGKRTVFADDGSISQIVEVGKSSEGVRPDEKEEIKEDASDWKKATSKKAIRQARNIEKALKRAAETTTSKSKKRHKKV